MLFTDIASCFDGKGRATKTSQVELCKLSFFTVRIDTLMSILSST